VAVTYWLRDEYYPYRRVTPADVRQGQRDRAAQLFSVGDGRLIALVSPAQPLEDIAGSSSAAMRRQHTSGD
jgi:hypothetical protein